MNKPATVLDYSRRIERVARHIGAHLDQPLELARSPRSRASRPAISTGSTAP